MISLSTVSTGDGSTSPSTALATVNSASPSLGTQAGPKPTVIGLYGISGSGKSFLLSRLREELGQVEFAFFEGSDKIASLVPGGLEAFHKLDEQSKSNFRGQAIDAIREESAHSGRVAIVTGHLMFWSEEHAAGQPVYTSNDLQTFTHAIYLNISAEVISQRRLDDKLKDRTLMPVDHLHKWQEAEISAMRHLCRQHHILFSLISEPKTSIPRISTLIRHFRQSMTIESNLARVRARLDGILALSDRDDLETVLVMDGDKTLAAEDTGALFWQTLAQTRPSLGKTCPLQELFSSPLGYSDAAFHQATLLYEEATDDEQFGIICDTVASSVVMHPEIVSLLRLVADQKHIRALVVTCGLGRVWEKVLERHGLSKSVDVIGGGRISDGFVVTAAVKADVVSHLRNAAHLYVWAFGDSPLDLPMLKEADQAIVVVGDKRTRSSSMDAALSKAIQDEAFQARQVLLPNWAPPRLDEDKLPLIRLDDQQFIGSMMHRRRSVKILHATDRNAAKLLTSPTRDAEVAGPALREAHGLVGRYLATEFVSRLIGLEEYTIPHVQGYETTGHRLRNEHQTSIVALMRGGEAMAFGVNAAFPHAMFIHAASATDIKRHHVDRQCTVILVDSVVNSGKTLMEFIEHVHSLNPSIRIVVVAGVVQAEVVVETHALAKLMGHYGASIVALRLSENKFTGTKTTDTGNRLFNTTHLA
ncbi:hypothetical protein AUP68_06166 [Ilyonectria robusta]